MRTRAPRTAIVIGALVVAQLAAMMWYRSVQRGRDRAGDRDFPRQRLSAGSRAPELEIRHANEPARRVPGRQVANTTLLHFWATWCEPCRQELPGLLASARALRGRVELVAISVDGSWGEVERFFTGAVPGEVYRALDQRYRRYGVELLPTTYVLGDKGEVRFQIRGARDWSSPAGRSFLGSL